MSRGGIAAFVFAISIGGSLSAAPAAPAAGVPVDSAAATRGTDSIRIVRVLPPLEVTGVSERAIARRTTASQGVVTPRDLANHPLLRTGDVLETVPGLLVTQHSGEGKANQYYLRGFNLDHGTDFATTIAGVPVNMPTNAHGQGYTDLNFLIPEMIAAVEYRKGVYSVEDGDFSSAGSAHIGYRNALSGPILSLTGGEQGYRRAFAAASTTAGSGDLLGALELGWNDGPWVHPDDYRKVNGFVRYARGDADRRWSLTAVGYDSHWNSTDQVPERAVTSGRLARFGAIDPTDGGASSRYSLSGEMADGDVQSLVIASAYLMKYRLDLFSNFTYFLTDTVRGDQFEQFDDRVVAGFRVASATSDQWLGRDIRQTIGLEVRGDDIAKVGLYDSEARRRFATVREDRVLEASASPFIATDVTWWPHVRTTVGARADAYWFDVNSSFAPFSGNDLTAIVSPKATLALGPWGPLELYASGGYGFHSSDARGARFSSSSSSGASLVAAAADVREAVEHFPVAGGPKIERGALLVRTQGAEVGLRLANGSRASLTAALWGLDIASESVFQGDAGLVAPSRPSRRTGIEVASEARPLDAMQLDADLAWSRARFRDTDPAGDRIPGAVEGVASAGIEYRHPAGELAGLRMRYFGPRPLIEDNSVRSRPSTILNAEAGYRARRRWSIALQVFNLLDAKVSDVDYFYTSRLQDEPAEGIADVHSHPQEPRNLRLVFEVGALSGP